MSYHEHTETFLLQDLLNKNYDDILRREVSINDSWVYAFQKNECIPILAGLCLYRTSASQTLNVRLSIDQRQFFHLNL